MPPDVSVIIPNLDGRAILGECLDALAAQTFTDFETIVVDNASRDGSAAFIAERYPHVRVVVLDSNWGFGGAVNEGAGVARGRYLALLNNDALAAPGWLGALVEAARRSAPGIALFASKILSHEPSCVIDTAGHLLYPDGINVGRGKGRPDGPGFNREEEILVASGCAMMVGRDAFDEAGGFDPDFFAYGDDTEFSLRLRLLGYRCLYVPASSVRHKGSLTLGAHSARKLYYIERARVWVLLKCFPMSYIIMSPFHTLKRLLFYALLSGPDRGSMAREAREGHGVPGLARIFIRANLDALRLAPVMLGKRRLIDATRRIGWAELGREIRRHGISARELVRL